MEPQRNDACNFTYHLTGGGPENDLPCLVEDGSVTSFWRPSEDDKWPGEAVHVFMRSKPLVELGFCTGLGSDFVTVSTPLQRAGGVGDGWTASLPLTDEFRAMLLGDEHYFVLRVHARPTPAVSVWVA